MEAKELRLGNLILDGGVITEVNYYILRNFKHLSIADHYEPIKITKEWLVKLDWQENGNWFYKDYYEMNLDGIFNPTDAHYTIHNDIRFIHQLQNIYFALTGDELTIKP